MIVVVLGTIASIVVIFIDLEGFTEVIVFNFHESLSDAGPCDSKTAINYQEMEK
jgi:hypothetical protein